MRCICITLGVTLFIAMRDSHICLTRVFGRRADGVHMSKLLMSDKFTDFRSKLRRYQVAMRWLSVDVYANYRSLSLVACVLMALSLALKLGALLLLSQYIHILDVDGGISIFGWSIVNPRQSHSLLLAAAGISLILFLGSCITNYYSDLSMLRLSVLYEERCVRRAIAIIGRLGSHMAMEPWRKDYTRLLTSDPRYCSTIARLVLRSFLPLASGVLTLGVLLYIDLELTLSLAILVLLAVPWLYRISVRGSASTKLLEHFTIKGNVEKRQFVAEAAARARGETVDDSAAANRFDATCVAKGLSAYLDRLKATVESTFAMSIVMAFAIFVILLQKGSELLHTGTGWGQLAAYLIVLRICLSNLTQLMGLITSLNRFYMHLYRFTTFVAAGDRLCEAGELAPATQDIWRRAPTGRMSSVLEEDLLDEI